MESKTGRGITRRSTRRQSSPAASRPRLATLADIASELATLTGDSYDDVLAAVSSYRHQERHQKLRAWLADARNRQHQIDGPEHFPACGRCMRCQRGIPCQRRIHANNGCPQISAHDRAFHERRRREAEERARES